MKKLALLTAAAAAIAALDGRGSRPRRRGAATGPAGAKVPGRFKTRKAKR